MTLELDDIFLPGVIRQCVFGQRVLKSMGCVVTVARRWRCRGEFPSTRLLADIQLWRIVVLTGSGPAGTVTGTRSIRVPDGQDFTEVGGRSGVDVGAAVWESMESNGTGRDSDAEGHHP